MECYSEQTCAIFADGELEAEEARRLRGHLLICPRCRELVNALFAENRLLSESLCELPEAAASPTELRRFRWSRVWGDLAVAAVVLALGSMASVWIDQWQIPQALDWLNPFSLGGATSLIFNVSDYLAHGGAAMLNEYAVVLGGLSLLLLLGGGALLLGRKRLPQPGLRLLILVLALSLPSFALEHRHGRDVTVAANETVDDTLIASGDTVRVDGVINGDLLAAGQTVEVRGTVKGDLLTCAQRTVVSGTVEGHIFTLSRSLELRGELGRSLYGWVQSLRVDSKGHVGDGIVVGAGDINLEGDVARSVTIFTGSADLSGNIGRELTMAGGHLTLTNTARVGGNLTAHVHRLQDVHVADGAAIAGQRNIQLDVRKNRFTRPKFYFHQALGLVAAMLVGLLGLVLFPGFFQASTQAVGSGWRSLGLGVGVLAGAPLVIVVAAITLVCLPISLMLLAAYLTAIYLAKIWVGAFLGRAILRTSEANKLNWLLGLLVGLVILTVVGFVPYLGGLIRLAVTCLGLGAFAWQLYRASRTPATA